MNITWPGYLSLWESGELKRRTEEAIAKLTQCTLCPRECRTNRLKADAKPYCRIGRQAIVSGAAPHHGEEDCLRGWNGSGTIFFCGCNLRCVFCQNFDISWQLHGRPVSPEHLALLMLELQELGCHNINLVTPSHVVPQILEGLLWATERGLRLPLVYNSGGYDKVETLRLLEGIVDIYMPDFKFWNPATAKELANASDYPEVARAAIKEMHRQVGDLVLDRQGLARRGLLVRHLVMPEGLEESRQIFRFLACEISPDTFLNVMPQYRPEGLTARRPAINRRLHPNEFAEAIALARQEGLRRLLRE